MEAHRSDSASKWKSLWNISHRPAQMSSLLQSLLLFPQPGLQHHTPVGAPFTEMALEMAPPGVMPFGGSRDSPLLCGFTALVVIWLLSCPTLHDPMDCNTPGSLSFIISQSLFILMSIELMMPSSHLILCRPLSPCPSQHQGLFQWVGSSHQVARVLEFQLQLQSFQWLFRVDSL